MRTFRALAAVLSLVALVSACGGAITSAPNIAPVESDGGAQETPGSQGQASSPSTPSTTPTPPTFIARVVSGQCLPEALVRDSSGAVPCEIVEALTGTGGEDSCNGALGLSAPDDATLARVRAEGAIGATTPLCAIAQLPPTAGGASCDTSASPGWCYLTGAATGLDCPQAIAFSPSGAPAAGAEVWMVCGQ